MIVPPVETCSWPVSSPYGSSSLGESSSGSSKGFVGGVSIILFNNLSKCKMLLVEAVEESWIDVSNNIEAFLRFFLALLKACTLIYISFSRILAF